MAATADVTKKEEERKKPTVPQIKRLESKEEWISEEELYTEGSSDEDDMALRMKRREQREDARRRAAEQAKAASESRLRMSSENLTSKDFIDRSALCPSGTDDIPITMEQEEPDECYTWRPTQGSFKLKQRCDSEEKPCSKNGPDEWKDLGDAYTSIQEMDKLLRDSDKKVKDAQEETLRAQMATRAHLKQLRDKVGVRSIAMQRNWDAFVRLCPLRSTALIHDKEGRGEVQDSDIMRFKKKLGFDDINDEADSSVAPRISDRHDDDDDDDDDDEESGRPFSEPLAITDKEKKKLSDLLRDVDLDVDDVAGDLQNFDDLSYGMDMETKRSLEDIDDKLKALRPVQKNPESAVVGEVDLLKSQTKHQSRQSRLQDIEDSLKALSTSALEQVHPAKEEDVQRLLEDELNLQKHLVLDNDVLSKLLEEAMRDMPLFQFRHRHEYDEEVPSNSTLS